MLLASEQQKKRAAFFFFKVSATNKNNNAVTHKQGVTRSGGPESGRGVLYRDDKSDKT